MSGQLQPTTTTFETRQRIARLRTELQELLEEWFHLQNVVRPKITAAYDALFHELEVEIQRKTLEAAEIGRRAELFELKHRRGERITPDVARLINLMVDKEFKKMRQRVYEAFDMTAEERNTAAARAAEQQADSDFPKMYRTLVKKLHPDVSNESEKFGKYWDSVQTAFETKNAAHMRALFIALAGDETDTQTTYPDALTEQTVLEHQEQDLRQKVERERRKVQQLRSEEPFTLEVNLDNPLWVTAHRENLQHQIANKERDISRSREVLEKFTGRGTQSAASPDLRHKPPSPQEDSNGTAQPNDEKKQEDIQSDFFESTYFGKR